MIEKIHGRSEENGGLAPRGCPSLDGVPDRLVLADGKNGICGIHAPGKKMRPQIRRKAVGEPRLVYCVDSVEQIEV